MKENRRNLARFLWHAYGDTLKQGASLLKDLSLLGSKYGSHLPMEDIVFFLE